MKLKLIKEITILSNKFIIEYDKTYNGGSFSYAKGKMTIGIQCLNSDPGYVLSIISHEIMEIVLTGMGARFDNTRTGENYLFNFDHQTFENAIQIHAQNLIKFIQ